MTATSPILPGAERWANREFADTQALAPVARRSWLAAWWELETFGGNGLQMAPGTNGEGGR